MVIPGEQAPPAVHAAAYALNAALGAVGKTVVYTETVNPMPSEQVADLKSLVGDMNAGKVQWLVMLGVNPLYSAPADLEFAAAFDKVPNTVHLGSHVDETGVVSACGTSTRRTTWRAGRMRARTTARSPSFSR